MGTLVQWLRCRQLVPHTVSSQDQHPKYKKSKLIPRLVMPFKNLNKETTQVESFLRLDYQKPIHQDDSSSLVWPKGIRRKSDWKTPIFFATFSIHPKITSSIKTNTFEKRGWNHCIFDRYDGTRVSYFGSFFFSNNLVVYLGLRL